MVKAKTGSTVGVGIGIAAAIGLVACAGAGTDTSVERNLDENPSFEVNIAGVSVIEGTVTQSSTKAKYGFYSCRAERGSGWMRVMKKKLDGSMYPVVAGKSYIHSVQAQMELGDAAWISVGLLWYDESETFISESWTNQAITDSAWTLVQNTAIAPSNATFAIQEVDAYAGFDTGEAVYLDGQELRQATVYKPPYIDGDQEFSLWEGTAHQSSSIRESILSRPPVGSGESILDVPEVDAGIDITLPEAVANSTGVGVGIGLSTNQDIEASAGAGSGTGLGVALAEHMPSAEARVRRE